MQTLFTYGIMAIVCGVIGMAIGDLGGKKNGLAGLLLGCLLGPIGCIITAVLPAEAMPRQQMRSTTRVLLVIAALVPVLLYALYVWMQHALWG